MARTPSPGRLDSPSVVPPVPHRSPGRVASSRGRRRGQSRAQGGLLPSGARPVDSAVESPISVGSDRYCFKWTEYFETGRKGGVRKRNSTAFDNCPAACPSPEGERRGGSARSAVARRARGAAPFPGAHLPGNPPPPPSAATRPPGFVCGVALRRSLAPRFPVCSL